DAVSGKLILVDDGADTLADGRSGSIRDACEPLPDDDAFADAIALIERGGCDFQDKLQRVEAAGAIGAIVYNTTGGPIVMNGDSGSAGIPAVMIGASDGQRLVDRLVDGAGIEIRLLAGVFLERSEQGNQMAAFSSRGPSLSEPDFLKPDITAPGVDILAGHTPDVANGLRGELFQYLSGTSMAAPEVAGIAALLKEAHPDWSAGMLKSALSTSAHDGIVSSSGNRGADPFEAGSGHVDPNEAADPGLVYDSDLFDHAAFLCGLRYPPFVAEDCDLLAEAGYSFSPRELNLPSIGVSRLITGDVVTRRVTNVGPAGTYQAEVAAPPGIDVIVTPSTLSLGTGESANFSVEFIGRGAGLDTWAFGELNWSDGERNVRSPIAVQPVTLRAPERVTLTGSGGSFPVPISFGYDGDYFTGIHGLRAAYIEQGFVDEDEANAFSFRFDDGVTVHMIDVPPDQLYARFALFDDSTDGADDLDLYLFHCPDNDCVQVAESGGFTSEEEINLILPEPGLYAVLVHGFETDPAGGGAGSNYELFAWSVGLGDFVGNMSVAAPSTVSDGDHYELDLAWSGLAPATHYLGALSHNTPSGIYSLSIVDIRTP
ncbi:MAG: S8 family serine peptidase, partial [Gammaproteobacteria bacterium]|nr:S8 family serine peptidase [Gammaproteobacteria bacterium]